MSLTDELAAERAGRPAGGRCRVTDLYTKLDKETTAELRAALADVTIPSTVIADVLARRGHDITDRSLQHHRKQGRSGGCKCEVL